MATHDYIIANASGAAVRGDLNNALAAIVSNNSSSSEPATTYAYQWWADTTNNQLKIRNGANNAWIVLSELDGTRLIEDGSATAPGLAFADDTNTGIFSPANDALSIATGGVERVQLDGTETVFNDDGADVNFRVESDGQTHCLFVDAGNNKVGINASDPEQPLDVRGSARIGGKNTLDAELQIGSGATGNRNSFIDFTGDTTYSDYGLRIIRGNGGPNTDSTLSHRGTGALALTAAESGGNVRMKVGTTSILSAYSNRVDISQTVNLSSQLNLVGGSDTSRFIDAQIGGGTFYIRGTTGGDSGHKNMITAQRTGKVGLFHNGSEAAYTATNVENGLGLVVTGGLLRITSYTTSTSGANVRMTSGGYFKRVESTRASKTNILNITDQDAINFLNNARPVTFNGIDEPEGHEKTYGFIAEEMADVDPRLTEYDENGTPISVEYSNIPSVLTKIVQLQKGRIDALETRLAALEAAD